MNDRIKRIYIGLPEGFEYLVLWVSREYRTNALSHVPGGTDVIVEYHSGNVFGYDWIKMPSKYISVIFRRNLFSGNSRNYSQKEKLDIIKKEISRVFARFYTAENSDKVPFKEIWNSETSNELPESVLKEFDINNKLPKIR